MKPVFLSMVLLVPVALLISCATSNPTSDRVLINLAVSPTTADAQSFPNGQVQFTATGTFSLPPLSGPVPSTAPYNGSFFVDNPSGQTVATIVSTGSSTITVQCAAGASGSVEVGMSALANNGTSATVSAFGQLTCP